MDKKKPKKLDTLLEELLGLIPPNPPTDGVYGEFLKNNPLPGAPIPVNTERLNIIKITQTP